jgi:cytochrome b subunit of formate dehydrogenase
MVENDVRTEDYIRRFHTARIVEHWVLIVIFAILLVTGLSQKFHALQASQWLILHMGGIDAARLLHRYAGFALLLLAGVHIAALVLGFGLRGWEPSMLVTRKDLTDAVHNTKYYLGMEDSPAGCGRYDYKQKFVYWGILSGSLIMVGTGLTLWFPATVVRLLPGELVPAAKALHTNEALLILLLIALWHVYDSIFSPDVFPLDKNIFTGRISRERMRREHPRELERMERGGTEHVPARRSPGLEDEETGIRSV